MSGLEVCDLGHPVDGHDLVVLTEPLCLCPDGHQRRHQDGVVPLWDAPGNDGFTCADDVGFHLIPF